MSLHSLGEGLLTPLPRKKDVGLTQLYFSLSENIASNYVNISRPESRRINPELFNRRHKALKETSLIGLPPLLFSLVSPLIFLVFLCWNDRGEGERKLWFFCLQRGDKWWGEISNHSSTEFWESSGRFYLYCAFLTHIFSEKLRKKFCWICKQSTFIKAALLQMYGALGQNNTFI